MTGNVITYIYAYIRIRYIITYRNRRGKTNSKTFKGISCNGIGRCNASQVK